MKWCGKALHWLLLAFGALVLAACGGGDSSVTTVSGPGLSGLGASPPVSLYTNTIPFVQKSNNLKVVVDSGPQRQFSSETSTNILYADVKVCEPNSSPEKCVTIPHVLVDTGSVGLRILAKKVQSLNLAAVQTPSGQESWECYPFVIGGLWGRNVVADVKLGNQDALSVPIQLIQDDTAGPQATEDCAHAAGGTLQKDGTYSRDGILDSVDRLGSNGILGIGNTEVDCGLRCVLNDGTAAFYTYYGCTAGAVSSSGCVSTALDMNFQVYNPVAALTQHNNGVVLALPAVSFPGASMATGELIFGIDTSNADINAENNMRPSTMTRVLLGTDAVNNPSSYLNITTTYNTLSVTNSYLDTGTNGLFFSDNTTPCPTDPLHPTTYWYCPFNSLKKQAVLSDGDNPLQNQIPVSFTVDNAEAIFSTTNTAFAGLAGSPPVAGTFAWGLPFFYGRRVFLSMWRQTSPVSTPWYAWESL